MLIGKPALLAMVGALAVSPTLGHADTVVVEPSASTSATVVTDPMDYRMFASGLTTFAIAYGAGVTVAATTDRPSNDHLYVPIAGPWLALADRSDDCRDVLLERCDNETTSKVLLVIDGVFQGAGALAMLEGLLVPSTHVVRTRTAGINIRPTTVKGHPGLAIVGSF